MEGFPIHHFYESQGLKSSNQSKPPTKGYLTKARGCSQNGIPPLAQVAGKNMNTASDRCSFKLTGKIKEALAHWHLLFEFLANMNEGKPARPKVEREAAAPFGKAFRGLGGTPDSIAQLGPRNTM